MHQSRSHQQQTREQAHTDLRKILEIQVLLCVDGVGRAHKTQERQHSVGIVQLEAVRWVLRGTQNAVGLTTLPDRQCSYAWSNSNLHSTHSYSLVHIHDLLQRCTFLAG